MEMMEEIMKSTMEIIVKKFISWVKAMESQLENG